MALLASILYLYLGSLWASCVKAVSLMTTLGTQRRLELTRIPVYAFLHLFTETQIQPCQMQLEQNDAVFSRGKDGNTREQQQKQQAPKADQEPGQDELEVWTTIELTPHWSTPVPTSRHNDHLWKELTRRAVAERDGKPSEVFREPSGVGSGQQFRPSRPGDFSNGPPPSTRPDGGEPGSRKGSADGSLSEWECCNCRGPNVLNEGLCFICCIHSKCPECRIPIDTTRLWWPPRRNDPGRKLA